MIRADYGCNTVFSPNRPFEHHNSCRAYRSFGALPWARRCAIWGRDEFHYQARRHLDFRKGKVFVVFNNPEGDAVTDGYGALDVHWQGTLTILVNLVLHVSTGGNARTQLEAFY